MPPRRQPAEAPRSVGGAENWNDLQTVALSKAWYYVSANPARLGAGHTRDLFFESVLVGYNYFYKQLGGVVGRKKKGQVYQPRTTKACKNKWQAMNL